MYFPSSGRLTKNERPCSPIWKAVVVWLLAMSGVPRLCLLADGRRPVMQVEAAELVVSFLPLRVPRAFDLMVPMYGLGGRPLDEYCAFLHACIYGTDGRVVDDANEGHDDDFIQELEGVSVIVVNAVGVGAPTARAAMLSIFAPPVTDFALQWRAERLARMGLRRLQYHIDGHDGWFAGVNSDELAADMDYLRDLLQTD